MRTIKELQEQLKSMNLPYDGNKQTLEARLLEALLEERAAPKPAKGKTKKKKPAKKQPAKTKGKKPTPVKQPMSISPAPGGRQWPDICVKASLQVRAAAPPRLRG